jgi:hypothetical protein
MCSDRDCPTEQENVFRPGLLNGAEMLTAIADLPEGKTQPSWAPLEEMHGATKHEI